MNLEAEHIMTIHVQCGQLMEVKNEGAGFLRVIPIIGGTVEGKISGQVVPGGADWNTSLDNNLSHVFAKYLLKTDDGEYIDIQNEGYINFELNNKIKTSPVFKADMNGKYAWLNHGVYVGALDPGKEDGQVVITVYRLR